MAHTGLVAAERRQRIVGFVHERGNAVVSELSDLFQVSEVTVRADLSSLARRGLVVRTHGGAVVPERQPTELTFATREVSNAEMKRRICRGRGEILESG